MNRKFLIVSLYLLLFSSISHSACKALLFNGGSSSYANYAFHADQLKGMYEALLKKGCSPENILVLSGEGNKTAKDFRKDPNSLEPEYVSGNYEFFKGPDKNLRASTKDSLKASLKDLGTSLDEEDTVFVYVSDHGQASPKKGISAWNYEVITPEDLDSYLRSVPTKNKVKVWTECCYCGVMNRLKRPNTCVATSTDENHIGDYFLNTASPLGIFNSKFYQPQNNFSDALGSGKDVSLSEAASQSQLDESNRAFRYSAEERGDPVVGVGKCRLGPQNSAEDFLFKTLKIEGRSVCDEDIPRLLEEIFKSNSNTSATSCQNPTIDSFRSIKEAISSISESKVREQASELMRTLETSYQLQKTSPEYLQIQNIEKDFSKLSEIEKLKNAASYQMKADSVLQALISAGGQKLAKDTYKNWKKLLEVMFYAKASERQKAEYQRRLSCLSEPLF